MRLLCCGIECYAQWGKWEAMTETRREAAFADAKRRYKRLMVTMLAITVALIGVSFAWLAATGTPMRLHFLLAVSLGIFFSLMLGAALMGLVFFSNASGADDEAADSDIRN
jgi:hypothetical protein